MIQTREINARRPRSKPLICVCQNNTKCDKCENPSTVCIKQEFAFECFSAFSRARIYSQFLLVIGDTKNSVDSRSETSSSELQGKGTKRKRMRWIKFDVTFPEQQAKGSTDVADTNL